METEWNSRFLKYEDAIKLVEAVHAENSKQISQIAAYFERINSAFFEFKEEAPNLTNDNYDKREMSPARSLLDNVQGKKERGPQIVRRGSCETEVSRFQHAHLCQIDSFNQACKVFSEEIVPFVKTFHAGYDERMSNTKKNMQEAIKTLADMKAKFECVYDRYKTVADELKKAYDRMDPKLDEFKARFIAVQSEAVEVHTGMNQRTAQTAMQLDTGLKEFEEIEQWRFEQVKELMIKIGKWMEDFAKQIQLGNRVFVQIAKLIPEISSLNRVMDCSELIPPSADDRFQLLKIDPKLTAMVDPHELFKEEQAQGKVLYRVTEEQPGHGEFLKVVKGEIVVCLERRVRYIKAKNINECEGLIPANVVATL